MLDPSVPDYSTASSATLAPGMASIEEVVRKSVALFNGMPAWNHPLTMANVIPPANTAAILAAMMTEVFSPNIIEGEYAWKVEFGELESAAMLARLVGWDPVKAGGLYTFGGSGCYLYGLKYALTQVLGAESRHRGIRTDAKLLVSQQGHYCKMNSTDWTGLGMNNIIEIETDVNTNAMNLDDLESVMKRLYESGVPIASIVCTMGTTDAFAVDPVEKVRALIEKYPNPGGFGQTFLYCDAVIGWAWLAFGKYDFNANPLGFSPEVLPLLQKNYDLVKGMVHADAIGCDFRKSGWTTYNCSMFLVREMDHYKELMNRPGSAYLQERTSYNPGLYTLEVSRSGSYAMAGWATLKFLGHEGFQAILGGILELSQYLRDLIAAERSSVCVNLDDHGFVTLFRVYPDGIDAETQYQKELTDPAARDALIRHNDLQRLIADKLWDWFRSKEQHGGEYAPYISYTSGFRNTEYNQDGSDDEAVIYALKSFPMNMNIDARSMDSLVRLVLLARNEAWKELTARTTAAGARGAGEQPSRARPRPVRGAVDNLLSGTGRGARRR